jgi:6-phosphogluconolactonase
MARRGVPGVSITRLLVGGYTAPRGTGAGLVVLEHDTERGSLDVVATAAETESPTAVAVMPDGTVIAVEESDPGRLHTFRWVGAARLERVSTQPSGGADPCHLLVHPSGRHVLTANYSGASIAAHAIGSEGGLGPPSDIRTFAGHGPSPDRQDAPHPHMITARPGSADLAVADLGCDLVRVLGFDEATGTFGADREPLVLPPGSGPRQIVFAADGRTGYVLGELDGSLTVSDWTGATPIVTAHRPGTAGEIVPPDNCAATLALVDGGRTLLASHRGADVVSEFAVIDGAPVPRTDRRSGGRGPRHFAVRGRWLYVADEVSDGVTVLDREGVTATVTAGVASPTWVLPLVGDPALATP